MRGRGFRVYFNAIHSSYEQPTGSWRHQPSSSARKSAFCCSCRSHLLSSSCASRANSSNMQAQQQQQQVAGQLPALSEHDLPQLLQLLQTALSTDSLVQKQAESMLASLEGRVGFCSCLAVGLQRSRHPLGATCWLTVDWGVSGCHHCCQQPLCVLDAAGCGGQPAGGPQCQVAGCCAAEEQHQQALAATIRPRVGTAPARSQHTKLTALTAPLHCSRHVKHVASSSQVLTQALWCALCVLQGLVSRGKGLPQGPVPAAHPTGRQPGQPLHCFPSDICSSLKTPEMLSVILFAMRPDACTQQNLIAALSCCAVLCSCRPSCR
jgi:hypothetical protein